MGSLVGFNALFVQQPAKCLSIFLTTVRKLNILKPLITDEIIAKNEKFKSGFVKDE